MISVLNDPVFRVERLDGTVCAVGLIELLRDAHRLKDVLARTPTGKIALIQLLLAFLLEAYRPQDTRERRKLFAAGAFDEELLTRYANEYGDRFYLDDDKHPFMQSPYDSALDDKVLRPVAALMADLPSGNAHIHLNHQGQDGHELDAGMALEALLETYMFCPAGLAGPSNINNTPPVYCIVRGNTLFETLVLNMTSSHELANIPLGAGEAAWVSDEIVIPREACVEMSLIRAMTWRPRRAKLVFDEDGMVRSVYLQAGLDFRGNDLWLDPRVPYRKTKNGQWASLKPELGRRLWRDIGMLTASKLQNERPPVTLANAEKVWTNCPAVLSVELTGLITNQAACLGWAHEVLSLPKSLLDSDAKSEEFRDYIGVVEDMRYLLAREAQKEFKEQVARQAGEAFLESMRAAVFSEILPSLAVGGEYGEDSQNRQKLFYDELKKALDAAIRNVIEKCGTGVKSMLKQNDVRRFAMGCYYKKRKEANISE